MLGIEDDGARQSALAHCPGNFHVQIAGFSHFSVHIGLGLKRLHIRIEADFVRRRKGNLHPEFAVHEF